MIALSVHLSTAQHWSHGWYPGGKREINLPQSPEVSEDIKLCDGEDCTYLKIPREKIVTTLLVDNSKIVAPLDGPRQEEK
uniref:Progonadoliberin-2 n=1 Tax=Sphaerodactylus townsendi TaxID=933632 RepID=A0ACB8E9A9_9SAUR